MELYAFFDLLAYAFLGAAIRRVEGVVAAEGAATGTDSAVAVRAAEAGVDADFLDTTAELARHIRRVGIETTVVTPDIHD